MKTLSMIAVAAATVALVSSPALSDEKVCAQIRTECVGGATCAEKCIPSRETPPDSTVGSGVRNPSTMNKPVEPNSPYSPRDLAAPSTPGGSQMPNSANPNGR